MAIFRNYILFFTLLAPTILSAQEEDEPPEIIQPDNEMILFTEKRADIKAFKYHVGIDGNFSFGNFNRELLAIRSSFDFNVHKILSFSTSPSFIYGRINNSLYEKEWFGDIKGSLWYRRRLHPIVFSSFEKSNLRKINGRYITAAGISYKLIDKPKAHLSLTNFILLEDTDYVPNDKFSDRKLWRNSIKLQGEYKMAKEKFILSHLLYMQPAISQKNIRWNSNLIMRYVFSKHISFRTVLEDYYESLVVPGRKNNDFRFTFGLSVDGVK